MYTQAFNYLRNNSHISCNCSSLAAQFVLGTLYVIHWVIAYIIIASSRCSGLHSKIRTRTSFNGIVLFIYVESATMGSVHVISHTYLHKLLLYIRSAPVRRTTTSTKTFREKPCTYIYTYIRADCFPFASCEKSFINKLYVSCCVAPELFSNRKITCVPN